MAPPFDGGVYADWTWQQVQAAVLAGTPKTFEDAGKHFAYAKEKLDDVAAAGKKGTEDLTGPGGTWAGPASAAFTGLMNEVLTIVVGHADVLGGPPSYQSVLDTAGDDLTDARTAVKEAMTQAAQDTIDRYNDDVTAYNTAATAYNSGNGPPPGDIGPAPYVENGGAGLTVDVSRYPEIEAALDKEMRKIITTLADAYATAGGRLTDPGDAPPPSPADLPGPALKTDVDGADVAPPVVPPPVVPPPVVPPPVAPPPVVPGTAAPPAVTAPRAPGVGGLSLVTEPGALDAVPRDAADAPKLVPLDPAVAAPPPITAGLQIRPGAGFDGVLGDRPYTGPRAGARPGGVAAPPGSAPSGTLGAPPPVGSADLVPPAGLLTTGPFPPVGGTANRPPQPALPSAPGAPRAPVPPPMPLGGGYGLMSAGPDGTGRRTTEGGPMPLSGEPYGGADDERERRNEYVDRDDDAWGSAPGAPTLGR
ncbi:WXG100 family type VII secretion target [Actinomadura syzygii]|uniref:WXG100 family type VII secretion target n=1 Tax=Actinomadura syzygii TaxID=1427538 RepID=UPI001651C59E|nr:hypothetical protein [Actinomadura syzygii]